jgi:FkbM family methyltransferase
MEIFYGVEDNQINITELCLDKLLHNNIITIPSNDFVRANYFSDPALGFKKYIYIKLEGTVFFYSDSHIIKINITNNEIFTIDKNDIDKSILNIHSKLKINYGSFKGELPEQKMAIKHLNGNEKILEIGGNIGRNTLIIAFILQNDNNLLSLECDENIAERLVKNRHLNNFNFHIEKSALSKRKLIQKNWDTKPSDVIEEGFKWVNTIQLQELRDKYNIDFDTLVLDCEGAFYYILLDTPEILDNINLIIMENDYHDASHKQYVDEILTSKQFVRVYVESGGWEPCYDVFFEVWKKRNN